MLVSQDVGVSDVFGSIPALMFADFNNALLHVGQNSPHAVLLGPEGVGDLTTFPGIKNVSGQECGPDDTCYLDNRHMTVELVERLCDTTPFEIDESNNMNNMELDLEPTIGGYFRHYFDALVSLAWPGNVQLWLCCEDPAGADTSIISVCEDPSFVLPREPSTLGIAPHFLTGHFGQGQQEALTAAFVSKINIAGDFRSVDISGRFDLGAAGTKLITRENPEEYTHKLGRSWGNMFLDCDETDNADAICQASLELDRQIGRDNIYHSLPFFSCSDDITKITDKTCFGEDMITNTANGCGTVAAVGDCDDVCVGNFCGVNDPPVDGRGSTNVLYVHVQDHPDDEDEDDSSTSVSGSSSGGPEARKDSGGVVALSIVLGIVVLLSGLSIFYGTSKGKSKVADANEKPDTSSKPALESIDEEDPDKSETV